MSNEATNQSVSKLDEAITSLIEGAVAVGDKTTTFLSGEIPLYVQELLMWHGWYNFIWFIVSVIYAGFWIFYARKYFKWAVEMSKKPTSSSDDIGGAFGFGIVGFGLSIIPWAIMTNLIWLQIWIAPRVYLVEYAADLLK